MDRKMEVLIPETYTYLPSRPYTAGKLQYRSKLSVEMKERYVWICGAYHLLLSPLEHVGSVTEGSNFMTEGSK